MLWTVDDSAYLATYAVAGALAGAAAAGGSAWLLAPAAAVLLVAPPVLEELVGLAEGRLPRADAMLYARHEEEEDDVLPTVYDPSYNITACGLERLHPFDSTKYGRIADVLRSAGRPAPRRPRMPAREDLLRVHTRRYLASLHQTSVVAGVLEVPVCVLPSWVVRRCVLQPLRLQAGGTALAARLAMRHGRAVNLGGGFHHCSRARGGGFCAYADLQMAVALLRCERPGLRVLYVDLDAHQGNGFERDAAADPGLYVFDVYNPRVYPGDRAALAGANRQAHVHAHTSDERYLAAVRDGLDASADEFGAPADLVLYNAGTDCMRGDPLGGLSLSPDAIVERDELVFRWCAGRGVPVCMVLSGGYQRSNAPVIARSLLNLAKAFGGVREGDE